MKTLLIVISITLMLTLRRTHSDIQIDHAWSSAINEIQLMKLIIYGILQLIQLVFHSVMPCVNLNSIASNCLIMSSEISLIGGGRGRVWHDLDGCASISRGEALVNFCLLTNFHTWSFVIASFGCITSLMGLSKHLIFCIVIINDGYPRPAIVDSLRICRILF